jgi:hypothetical protein
MLNKNALFLISERGDRSLFSDIKYDVSCGLLVNALYQMDDFFFIPSLLSVFTLKGLRFYKMFFLVH